MRKIRFNGRGIANGAGNIIKDPAFIGVGFGLTIFAGIGGIIYLLNQPSEEDILLNQFDTEIMSTYEDGKTYKLVSEDVVRVDENGLLMDFHFSSGDIYVQTDPQKHYPEGQDAVFSSVTVKDFDDVARPEWIDEVRQIGCDIAQAPISYEGYDLIGNETQVAADTARGFSEMHCD